MSKKFKLLKDLPGIKAGCIFGLGTANTLIIPGLIEIRIHREVLEQYPDWFEPMVTEFKEITLANGEKTIVDACDFGWLNQFCWYKSNSGYVCRGYYDSETQLTKPISMAREILGISDQDWLEIQADHINNNKLDNRRDNLRTVTPQQNSFNRGKYKIKDASSKYVGVSWQPHANKWKVKIEKDKKAYHVGYFNSEIEAALAYNKKAKELFGKCAFQNVIEPVEERWKPKEGEIFYTISFGNCFPTNHKAEIARNKIKKLLEEMRERNGFLGRN